MKKKSLVALSIISCLTAASVLSACNTSSPVADKGEESSTAKEWRGSYDSILEFLYRNKW